jgi:ribosomal protein S1
VALVAEGSARERQETAASDELSPGARLIGKVERHEKFGVFVFLGPGRTALMPLDETGVPRGGDVVKALPIGADVEVVVLDVDSSKRRIRVSRKAVQDAQDADELREYRARVDADAKENVGTLADRLRSALEPRKP